MNAPDPRLAAARYREHAPRYDTSAARSQPIRAATIAHLGLVAGDVVLDVACGTGLSFPLLVAGVGPGGRVVGVDVSAEMLDVARRRVGDAGWCNVTLIEAPLDEVGFGGTRFDAILFNYAHDVLRSPPALARILAAAKPGARIAVAGLKYYPWWLAPLNPWVRARARPYATTLDGLSKPWSLLAPYLDDFARESRNFGSGYIAWGRVRG